MMNRDEKMAHINAAEEVLDHELVVSVCEEFASSMGFEFDGLPRYGLLKVAKYAATVARAQALGFDVDELRSMPKEYMEHVAHITKIMTDAGNPVTIVVLPEREEQ